MSRSRPKEAMDPEVIPGLNIQWPWSELLLSGQKTVETRSYSIPAKYLGQKLAVIETPGPRGRREAGIAAARIIGTITFSESFRYPSKKAWADDRSRHAVDASDPHFAYSSAKEKWGWVVADFERFAYPLPAPKKRGIIFATACALK